MNVSNNNFSSIEQVAGQYLRNQKLNNNVNISTKSFDEILKFKQENTLRFSKHASERLISRNIALSDEQLSRLENGTKKAQEKGINETLVMVDNIAFIVNVKNNTVVTAVDEASEKVFTNIDGAVII